MKKVLCLALLVVMVLGLCACAAPEKADIVGFWEGERNGETKYVWFSENGSYFALTFDKSSGRILDDGTYGEWSIDGNKVLVVEDKLGSTMEHKYSSGKLKNGEWTYEKSDDAEEFITDLFF